ncbi:DUF421 domain-containing protein [Paenibacillus sp. 1001270B_150601_E10]|uniref:DUF421 domain-containing protein n=1 Tax=Paenibacillus sp. 1001270B_150601_E10 TaxID=2787079 RepID=UPI002B4C131C|nr:DUF421 domain-containing protein [Paenibacillus sp. 1001270B_150601_E10]
MQLWSSIWHTMLMYVLVFAILRIMGKREIGKLSVFDLVISIMIAEIAVFSIEDFDKPIWESVVPMLVLVIIQISLAFITLRSRRAREWFDGKPSIIISQGRFNREEMRKQRYNLDDLMLQMREQGIDNLQDVQYAILESTGKLTVFLKDDANQDSQGQEGGQQTGGVMDITESPESGNASENQGSGSSSTSDQKGRSARGSQAPSSAPTKTAQDDSQVLKFPEQIHFASLPLPLIMDGRVMDENLEQIDKTRFWLKNRIQEHGVNEFKDVFFCSIDHRGRMFLDKKDALR